MGELFVCEDLILRRQVAVKALASHRVGTPDAQRRLIREARALAAIRHPGVVPIHDVGTTDEGGVYLVMELVHGETLRDRLRRGPLGISDTATLLDAAARALSTVHDAGLVHRDVKPDNLMIREDGSLVLVDFGLAKRAGDALANEGDPSWDTRDHTVTQASQLVGTPGYLAPEQIRGEAAGPATDQFQLAVTFFEALTGVLPWPAGDPQTRVLRSFALPPTAPSEACPDLPTAVDEVFARALSWRPEDRFPGPTAFAAAFAQAVDVRLSGPEAATTTLRSRSREHEDVETEPEPSRMVPSGVARSQQRLKGRATAVLATLVAVTGAAGVAVFAATREGTETRADGVATTMPPMGPDDAIACPPLRVKDDDGSRGWLGAAAAVMACGRAVWSVGGDETRVILPAKLAGLPPQPTDDFPEDPWTDASHLDRAQAAARELAVAIRGDLQSSRFDDFAVTLRAWRGDTPVGPPVRTYGSVLWRTVFDAVDRLQEAGSLPPPRLDDEVASWDRLGSLSEGQAVLEADYAIQTGVELERYCDPDASGLPAEEMATLAPSCANWLGRDPEFPLPPKTLDPSDPGSLAHDAFDALRADPSIDGHTLIEQIAEARRDVRDHRARRLASMEASVAILLGELERGRNVALNGLRTAPHDALLWDRLARSTPAGGEAVALGRAHAAWRPDGVAAWCRLGSALRGHEAVLPLRRCFVLGPGVPVHALRLVETLIDDDRIYEAETISAFYVSSMRREPFATAFLRARVQAAQKKLRAGLGNMQQALLTRESLGGSFFREADGAPFRTAIELASLLGQSETLADAVAERFILGNDGHRIEPYSFFAVPESVAVCLFVRTSWRRPCLQRVSSLVEEHHPPALPEAEAYLAGAEAWSRGEIDAAVDAWRTVATSPHVLLPLDALAEAGRRSFVRRVDESRPGPRFAGLAAADYRRARWDDEATDLRSKIRRALRFTDVDPRTVLGKERFE